MTTFDYGIEPGLAPAEFRAVLMSSGLGERRPVDDIDRLARMLANADLVVTARRDGELVGVARSITDHAYCTYLSDLAVAEDVQGLGVGRRLIAETRSAIGPQSMLVLLAAPDSRTYYSHVSAELELSRHDAAWVIYRDE